MATTTPYYPPRIYNPCALLADGKFDKGLPAGCYLLRYTPDVRWHGLDHYAGTLRVQRVEAEGRNAPEKAEFILASGDLYGRWTGQQEPELPPIPGPDSPVAELRIPVFPRADYRFYLGVKSVPYWSITPVEFNMVIESHSYRRLGGACLWYPEGQFIAKMKWESPPEGFPLDGRRATGIVYQAHGVRNGTLTMTWISPWFRRASLVIHHTTRAEPETPANPPGGKSDKECEAMWEGRFKEFGWLLKATVDSSYKTPDSQPTWSHSDIQDFLNRDVQPRQEPDKEWRYDLLCVPNLTGAGRGITLFAPETGAVGHVRELPTVAARYRFPAKLDPASAAIYDYDSMAGKTLDSLATVEPEKSPFLRTSMHEMGHAMGLGHNTAENACMITTDVLARRPSPDKPSGFPGNVKTQFSPGDIQRLRHWPDVVVRPGTDADAGRLPATTVPVFPEYGEDEGLSVPRLPASGVALKAVLLPNTQSVPLGAPVRVEFFLFATGGAATVPVNPSLKSGLLTISILNHEANSVKGITPLANDADTDPVKTIEGPQTQQPKPAGSSPPAPKADRVTCSVTLWGADDGPLFPKEGEYTLHFQVAWRDANSKSKSTGSQREYTVEDTIKFLVTPATDSDHVIAARTVLAEPLLQEVIVQHTQTQQFLSATDALAAAMRCEVLQPHYTYISFRVEADLVLSKNGDLKPAFNHILLAYPKVILTSSEKAGIREILTKVPAGQQTEEWYKKAVALANS